jgi:hypothetical protein
MDFTTGALLLAGAFNFLLAAIIVFHAPRTRANLCYALLVAWLLVWILAIIALRLTVIPALSFAALASSYTAGLGIALAFWYFAAFFTRRSLPFGLHASLLAGALFIAGVLWVSPDFIRGIARLPSGTLSLDIGPHGWLFLTYFAAVMLDAFRVLIRQYRITAEPERSHLLTILLGTFLTTIIGATFNVVFVQFGNASLIGWGPVATIIMVAFIAYAIVRHHLMSIHLVTAELFTFGLIVMLFVNFVVSPNPLPRLIEAVTLQLAIGFGTYVIRAALRDARAEHPDHADRIVNRRRRPRLSREAANPETHG